MNPQKYDISWSLYLISVTLTGRSLNKSDIDIDPHWINRLDIGFYADRADPMSTAFDSFGLVS